MNKWQDFDTVCDGQLTPAVALLEKDQYNHALLCVRACEGVPVDKLQPMALLNAIDGLMIAKEELAITDKLLIERERVLNAIPECPPHGKGCVPHALEWIAKRHAIHCADGEFLRWIHARLVKVHGENELVDYMQKLSAIIATVEGKTK